MIQISIRPWKNNLVSDALSISRLLLADDGVCEKGLFSTQPIEFHQIYSLVDLITWHFLKVFISFRSSNFESVVLIFSSVQSLSRVRLFVTPWMAAHQASLSITNPQSLLKLVSIESVMPSNHLILRFPLLLLPSILPSIRVFCSESALCIGWPKYWSFSFSIHLPMNIQS